MKNLIKILFVLIITPTVFAQNPGLPAPSPMVTSETAPVCPTCPTCKSCDRGKTEGYREKSFGTVMVGYQYANNWVPRKTTASYTQILNRAWSLEFEYATSERNVTIAGTDLGSMREDRYTFFAKYYIGNSFHVSFGPMLSEIKIDPSGALQTSGGGNANQTLRLESYSLGAAFGSRWQNSLGLTWGVDWFRVNAPIKDGRVQERKADLNQDGRTDVSRSFNGLRTIPTFTFVGVNIGYTF